MVIDLATAAGSAARKPQFPVQFACPLSIGFVLGLWHRWAPSCHLLVSALA
jgi:hypothetical protein